MPPAEAAITRIEARAYTVPTDVPEADGTSLAEGEIL